MTQSEMDEILKVEKYELLSDYLRDDYIYLVNDDGTDGVYNGLHNDLNQHMEAPYKVCPFHTQALWEQYLADHPVEPDDPTDPTDPEDPTDPTEPTEPTDPEDPTDPTEPTEPTEPDEPFEPTDPDLPET